MPITLPNALDELFGIVKSVSDANASGILGYMPDIRWPGVPEIGKPDQSKLWMRVSYKIVIENQASLSNDEGNRLYETTGMLYIQIFCPRNVANSLPTGRNFAEVLRNQFRLSSPSSAIDFYNQQVREIDPESQFYPINVAVEFRFRSDITGSEPLELPIIPGIGGIPRSKIFPVEALDGIRTSFTFLGIPSSDSYFTLIYNGTIADDFTQAGNVLTLDFAPQSIDSLYVYY